MADRCGASHGGRFRSAPQAHADFDGWLAHVTCIGPAQLARWRVSGRAAARLRQTRGPTAMSTLVCRYLPDRNTEALRELGDRPRVRFLHFTALDAGDLL